MPINSTLTLDTDYTVTLNPDQDTNPGGTITLTAGPLATGASLLIASAVPELQQTDLTNEGGFYPEVITAALDKLTILVQQRGEQIDRVLKVGVTDAIAAEIPSAPDRANKFLGFDDNGDPVAAELHDGATGPTGPAGTNATITVGTVTTGTPGSSVVVSNRGTTTAAVLDFAIPAGTPGANGSGSGTVTTVTVGNLSPLFTSSVTSPASSPSVNFSLSTVANGNRVLASPDGAGGAPTYRALTGADLPAPSSSTFGGVKSKAAVANSFVTGIGTDGVPTVAQPSFANLSGAATAAQLPSSAVRKDTAATLSGAITVSTNDLTLSTAGKGIVFTDAANGHTYRLYVDGGNLKLVQVT